MADELSSFYRGDTRTYKFAFTDSAGAAVDITGWQLWFTLKSDPSVLDAEADLQVSTTAGDQSGDDPVNGIMYLVVTSTDTESLALGRYHYDIQRVTPNTTPPSVETILRGRLKVLEDVTRSTS